MKAIKKIISLFTACALTAGVFSYTLNTAWADVLTTQENVQGVDSQLALTTYVEFNNKVTDGAFVIPGLVTAVSYNKDLGYYSTTQTMCPQAICKVGHYTLITAYDTEEASRSVIYVLGSGKELVKTLILPDSYHVGGIAYDSQNKVILITKASKNTLGAISYDDFEKYMSFSSSFVQVKYTVAETAADKKVNGFSSVAYKNGRVYVGTFGAGSSSYAYCYLPTYDAVKKTYSLKYQYKFYLPDYTQGFTFTSYKGKMRMFATSSYGRNETMGIYRSYLYTYAFDEQTGAKTFDNVLSCPPMMELTYAEGGKLYCLFESAANLYKSVSRRPIDMVIPISLSKLCDEKSGAVVNISVSNVNGGKKIAASCNVPGSAIYYNSSMPYYSGAKFTNGYKYKKAYTKTNTSYVYAVAVVGGRIIAADAVYVSVGKAAAPSKLKVKSRSKSSVTLSWKKASGATSYQIYRSTSKSKNYKCVATVSSSKNSYKDKSVKKNKKYYYKIRAVKKGSVNSNYTSVVSAKTK